MLKKLRRFILKKTIKGQLDWYLRELNLLEGEITEFKVLEEFSWGINFLLKTENQIFEDIWFHEKLEENMEIMEIAVKIDGIKVFEEITFSVSKWLTITPKTYKIFQRYYQYIDNRFKIRQKIDLMSGKIMMFIMIDDVHYENDDNTNLKEDLRILMEKIATDLFELNTVHLTIKTDDFCGKTYWISQEIRNPMLKPESNINFKQFHNLKNIF